MSRALQITCDGCGKAKQSANHWWMVVSDPSDQSILILPAKADSEDFQEVYEYQTARDFCGSGCALKYISEQLGKSEQ